MGDDRPYRVGGLLELPVHWSLDDWVHFGIGAERPPGDADLWHRTWLAEIGQAVEEGRIVTLTMHPEIIGRAHRLVALAGLLDDARALGVRFARHADVAAQTEGL